LQTFLMPAANSDPIRATGSHPSAYLIATLQRAAVLAWLLAILGVLAHMSSRGPTLASLVVLWLLLFGHAMVLAAEFALMLVVNRHEAIANPSLREVTRAWLHECLHAARVFGWLQPFRSHAIPDAECRQQSRQRGVVLVHGFACNRGVWQDWLERLRSLQVATVAVDLEPPWGPIDAYVDSIERAVAQIESATGLAPLIVAHSMGGLTVRRWWQTTSTARVHRLITLGTPHQGTRLARLGFAPNVRQMRCGNAWLDALSRSEGAAQVDRMTCFFSTCDNIVLPATHATLAGADNRILSGTAHVHMVSNPQPWAEALRQLSPPTD